MGAMNDAAAELERSKLQVAALTAPRNVVLVGASDRPGSWAARVWANLKRYGYDGPIHLVNPNRAEIAGQKCYPNTAALPEPPDHLVVLVPANGVIEVLREAAVKFLDRFLPRQLAFFDFVEFLFHASRETYVKDVLETLDQQDAHFFAEHRG